MNKKTVLIVTLVVVFIVIGVVVYLFSKSNKSQPKETISSTTESGGLSNFINQSGFGKLVGLI